MDALLVSGCVLVLLSILFCLFARVASSYIRRKKGQVVAPEFGLEQHPEVPPPNNSRSNQATRVDTEVESSSDSSTDQDHPTTSPPSELPI